MRSPSAFGPVLVSQATAGDGQGLKCRWLPLSLQFSSLASVGWLTGCGAPWAGGGSLSGLGSALGQAQEW